MNTYEYIKGIRKVKDTINAGNPPKDLICDTCGKPFRRRINISRKPDVNFCSVPCKNKWFSKNRRPIESHLSGRI